MPEDVRSQKCIEGRFRPYLLERDKARLNKYYYEHYSFWKNIEMVIATVTGRKVRFGEEEI